MGRHKAYAVAAGTALYFLASTALADTLADAARNAYEYNPTLVSQRAQLRALNESYVQARAGLRPKLALRAEADWDSKDSPGVGVLGATLDVPLYSGGRGKAQIVAAEADIFAGREILRETEGQVMLNVVNAFVQVRFQERVVESRRSNLKSLEEQLTTTQAQFGVREVTRTDLAQFEAAVEESRANLAAAEAELSAVRAAYRAVVGKDPGALEGDADLPPLPPTLEQALALVETDNPTLRSARYAVQAAQARLAAARADRMPNIGVQSSIGYRSPLRTFDVRSAARSVFGVASLDLPLYQGGALNSRVRQSGATRDARAADVERSRAEAVTTLTEAWSRLGSTTMNIAANEARLRATRIAFEGSWEERQVGLRTSLEVLSAQQALTNAEIAYEAAQRDRTLYAAEALNAVGRLTAPALAPGLPPYEPEKDFNRIRYSGWTPLDPLIVLIDGIGGPHLDVLPRGADLPQGAIPLN